MAPGGLEELEEVQERSIGIQLVQEYTGRLGKACAWVAELVAIRDSSYASLAAFSTCSMSELSSLSSLSHSKNSSHKKSFKLSAIIVDSTVDTCVT